MSARFLPGSPPAGGVRRGSRAQPAGRWGALDRVRAVAAGLLLAGCGSGSPLIGTWRYSLDVQALSADGGSQPTHVTFDLDLGVSAAPDLLVWELGGGCNVAIPVTGKVATLGSAAPLCGMTAGTKLPVLAETGVTVKGEDQLEVKAARFELLEDDRLSTSFEYKLYTDLRDSRVGPVVSLGTTPGKHGTRVK